MELRLVVYMWLGPEGAWPEGGESGANEVRSGFIEISFRRRRVQSMT